MPQRTCTVEGCGRTGPLTKAMCSRCYQRWRRKGSAELTRVRVDSRAGRTCEAEGCTEPYLARGLCKRHYRQSEYERKSEDILATQRAWRAANPEKTREAAKRKYAKHGDKIRQKMRELRQSNPESHRKSVRRYRIDNAAKVAESKRKWSEQNAERLAAYYREWAKRNPERRRESHRRRRARKFSTQADIVDYAAILAEHGMLCHLCQGEIADWDDLHFDHVIPLSRGGAHEAGNIRPSHAGCNLRKASKLIT